MTAIYPGKSTYGAILTETGMVSDDAIIANNGNDEWLLCHSSGGSMEQLQESAKGLNVDIELDDDLHNIALQGPKALSLLDIHTNFNLEKLAYFHRQEGEIFGRPCKIFRTGYSGERGYEILAASNHIGDIWDGILESSANEGVLPCSFTAWIKFGSKLPCYFTGMT